MVRAGDIVHVHSHPRKPYFAWPGYIVRIANDSQYEVSQIDRSSRATTFLIPRDELWPVVWTFQGPWCPRCKEAFW